MCFVNFQIHMSSHNLYCHERVPLSGSISPASLIMNKKLWVVPYAFENYVTNLSLIIITQVSHNNDGQKHVNYCIFWRCCVQKYDLRPQSRPALRKLGGLNFLTEKMNSAYCRMQFLSDPVVPPTIGRPKAVHTSTYAFYPHPP